jgi:hypothetical protein
MMPAQHAFSRIIAIILLLFFFSTLPLVLAYAQELEPRSYANTPVGMNFLVGGYAYSEGNVATEPSLPISDVEIKTHTAVLAYVRTLDLWGRSGKVELIAPFSWTSGTGKFLGDQRRRSIRGLNDPRVRISALLYGGPALSLKEFADHQPDLIIGASMQVFVPLGQYDDDKLFNLGTNRWTFKPELGLSKTFGPLTLELATAGSFYTDNDKFLGDKTIEQNPLLSVQGHLIYNITPGIWAALDAVYYTGSRSIVDGRRGESLENARLGLTLALPVNRYNSIKLYGTKGIYSKTGSDYDLIGVAWQIRWGAGL